MAQTEVGNALQHEMREALRDDDSFPVQLAAMLQLVGGQKRLTKSELQALLRSVLEKYPCAVSQMCAELCSRLPKELSEVTSWGPAALLLLEGLKMVWKRLESRERIALRATYEEHFPHPVWCEIVGNKG